jgi:hypothetical protein
VRCVVEQFVSYPQLSLHFRQHANNVTLPRPALHLKTGKPVRTNGVTSVRQRTDFLIRQAEATYNRLISVSKLARRGAPDGCAAFVAQADSGQMMRNSRGWF